MTVEKNLCEFLFQAKFIHVICHIKPKQYDNIAGRHSASNTRTTRESGETTKNTRDKNQNRHAATADNISSSDTDDDDDSRQTVCDRCQNCCSYRQTTGSDQVPGVGHSWRF